MVVTNQDIRKPVEAYLRANEYTFTVDFADSLDFTGLKVQLMIFSVTDMAIATNPVTQLFFRDSYEYCGLDQEVSIFPMAAQRTSRKSSQTDKELDSITDAVNYVSTRCRPIAARKVEVLDEEIRRVQEEKTDLERVAKEEKKDLQRATKQISSSDIEAFVNMLLSSHNLSDFLSQTVDRLQQEYGDSKEAHKAALALINEKLCYKVVRTYSPVIRGLDRA